MRMQHRSICLAAALALVGCQQPAPPPPPPPPPVNLKAEEARIRQGDKDLVAAIAARNIEGVMAFYGADAQFLAPNEEPATGAALRKSWTDLFAMPEVALNFEATTIGFDADATMAYDVGAYTLSLQPPQGAKVEDHGKYVEVWRKIGGKWKLVVDMYNTSVPLAGAPAAAEPPAAPAPPPATKK